MAEFTVKSLMCRAVRPTRLFRTPYDIEPTTEVLATGARFYSRKQYHAQNVDLLYISEGLIESTPTGYWCPASLIEYYAIDEDFNPIEEPNRLSDGSVKEYNVIDIQDNLVKVYPSAHESTPGPNGLHTGDRLMCDRLIDVEFDNFTEKRYRISSVIGDDQTVTGSWVAGNRAMKVSSTNTAVVHNASIKVAKVEAMDAPMTREAMDEGGSNAEQGMTVQSNQIYVQGEDKVVDVPPVDTSGTDEDINLDEVPKMSTESPEDVMGQYKEYNLYYDKSIVEGLINEETAKSTLMGIPIGKMLFVHGMPFQYTFIADRRVGSTMRWGDSMYEEEEAAVSQGSSDLYGREFCRNIASNMPVVVFAPGKPKFMSSVKSGLISYAGQNLKAARTVLPMLSSSRGADDDSVWSQLQDIEGEFQYYSIEIDTEGYYKYVNSICQTSARLMGLTNFTYRDKSCADFDWGKYNQGAEQDFSTFEEVIGLSGGVSFAFDPQSSVSDTITNSTTESQLAGLFSNVASGTRELSFILGYTGTNLDEAIGDPDNYVQQATAQLNTGAFAGLRNAIGRIGSWMSNSIHGMNMRFPEIWSDSNHAPSYDIEMHFITPYNTAFCKWRYVLVPFYHLFCMASPKADVNQSQYSAPFLIRAYSKGYFNIEMGLIESLTWKRFGDGGMIANDGVPTQIDVSVGLKDLYHSLTMTSMYDQTPGSVLATNVSNFMNNTGLMDLIGTLSGVNMNRISLNERMSMFISSNMTAWGSMGSNFMRHISDRVRNIADDLNLYGS